MIIIPPKKLEEWNTKVLDQLLMYPHIESETLDFKGTVLDRLYVHICAMANTSGGFIVLGVDEIKESNSKKLIEFKISNRQCINSWTTCDNIICWSLPVILRC